MINKKRKNALFKLKPENRYHWMNTRAMAKEVLLTVRGITYFLLEKNNML